MKGKCATDQVIPWYCIAHSYCAEHHEQPARAHLQNGGFLSGSARERQITVVFCETNTEILRFSYLV